MTRFECAPFSASRHGSTAGEAGTTVVWVRGDQDITTQASLVVHIARAADLYDVPVLVDLSAVPFMDASTIGAIVGSANRLRSRGRSLEVRAPSCIARRMFELCGLAHLICRDPLHRTGPAAALGTWVDVLPIRPAANASDGAADATRRATTAQTDQPLAAAELHIEQPARSLEGERGRQ